jgi:hypothetical protein
MTLPDNKSPSEDDPKEFSQSLGLTTVTTDGLPAVCVCVCAVLRPA